MVIGTLAPFTRLQQLKSQTIATTKCHSYILWIKNDLGSWVDDIVLIKEKFLSDFSKCFSSNNIYNRPLPYVNILSKVSYGENMALMKHVIEEESHKALFHMNRYKAPGPHRFGTLFFQKYWLLLKEQLYLAIQDFFDLVSCLRI